MKILIVLGHNRLTGVNTWAYTLAKELNRISIECDIEISSMEYDKFFYDDKNFRFISLLASNNIRYYINQEVDYSQYDTIILSYNCHCKKLNAYDGKKIFFVHGISSNFDGVYDSSNLDNSYTKIAASQYISERYFCHSFINHGIDLNFFYPNRKQVSSLIPKKAFILSRFFSNKEFLKALYELDIEYISPATHGTMSPHEIRENIWNSDFVVAVGRSAYESMACGKPVYLLGNDSGDGWVKYDTFNIFLYKNCSGYTNTILGPKEYFVRDIMKRYDSVDGKINERLSEKYLSGNSMARKFLKFGIM